MSEEKWVYVELAGHGRFYVEADVLRGERSGPVAPEHHMTDGELDWRKCFDGDSYAHAFPDERGVMRYHRKIAELSDLVPVGRIAVVDAPVSGSHSSEG